MLAAMLAALMSSLTSIFNSSTTIFTLDIWKKAIRKKAEEKELMLVGRLYTLVLVGASIAWLPILQEVQGSQFWDYVQEIYSHILPPIVCTFVVGLFWKRATEEVTSQFYIHPKFKQFCTHQSKINIIDHEA